MTRETMKERLKIAGVGEYGRKKRGSGRSNSRSTASGYRETGRCENVDS